MEQVRDILLNMVVPGLSAVLMAALFEVARQYAARIKQERLRALVLALVKAAEQIYGDGAGADKREYVMRRVPKGVTLPLVEAAVYDMKKEG